MIGVLILPGIKTFKASEVEAELISPKQVEPILSPSVLEEHLKEVEKLHPEYAQFKVELKEEEGEG